MADEMYKTPGQFEHDGMRFAGVMEKNNLIRIKDELELNSQDVLSVSFPKTGSTWVNEILLLIKLGADEQTWRNLPHKDRFPYIELDPPHLPHGTNFNHVTNTPSPRLVKSHLPERYFERHFNENGPKIVVAMRNPKDVLVSLYHFYRANKFLGNFSGTWDEFFELHKKEGLVYSPVCKYQGDWYKRRDEPNVFIIKYEELHQDTEGILRKLLNFLGKEFTDQQVADVIRLSSFDSLAEKSKANMKGVDNPVIDPKISPFFRKGKVGDWRNYYSEEQNAFIESQILEMKDNSGLEFRYE